MPARLNAHGVRHTHAKSAASCQANDLDHLEEPCSHAGRGGNKRGQTLGKDFSWTRRHITKKFPHREQDAHWLPSTGKIGQSALIATVNTGSSRATHGTMRDRLCGKQRDTQPSFLARACGHLKARREGKQGIDKHLGREKLHEKKR